MSASPGGSSLEDSDLDDIPLSMAQNGRYSQDEPPMTSKGPPVGFSRFGPGIGFQLKLPCAEERSTFGEALVGTCSEPTNVPDTARNRAPVGLGLPLAQLRAASASHAAAPEEEAPPRTRRGPHKPPMLNLVSPASASPVPSSTPTPAAFHSGPEPSMGPPAAHVRVELVSQAFLLENVHNDQQGEASTSDRITERCSRSLGISAGDLEFYELRVLEDGAIPESCTHVGVMIRGSTFSLSALEDLLARRKQDDQLTAMLERALRNSAQHAEASAKQAEELAVLREKLRAMEATNQHLKEQLKASDEHRHLLMGAIRGLVKEFGDIKSRMDFEGGAEQLALQQLSLGGGPSRASEPQASGSAGGTRDMTGKR